MEQEKVVVVTLYSALLDYYVGYVAWAKVRRQGKPIGFVTTVDTNLEHKECSRKDIAWQR